MADLDDVVRELQEIKKILREDRTMMWRVMIMLISGSFLLIGIKLMIP